MITEIESACLTTLRSLRPITIPANVPSEWSSTRPRSIRRSGARLGRSAKNSEAACGVWLLGWKDEDIIRRSIDRLHELKINRLRVTLAGRTHVFYGEPVMPGATWSPYITAWPAQLAEDIYHPGFDYARFDVEYWQKFERMLRYARDRDMIVSVVLDMNDSVAHPAPGGSDEHRYIHYAIDRLGAFSNVTWDLGDDLDSYRTDAWTHTTGQLLKEWDPYQHLATSHPVNPQHQDRASDWFDFTSVQDWSRQQHAFMLAERRQQCGEIIALKPSRNTARGSLPALVAGAPCRICRHLCGRQDIVMAGGTGEFGAPGHELA